MKYLKKENGFTLIDITVALIVILLFMSFISILFFNITKSSKGIERESQATYIATCIIEAYKSLDYDDEDLDVREYEISDGTEIGNQIINVLDGYNATVSIERYVPESVSSSNPEIDNDLVKIIKVTVKYKIANEEKKVELETLITR